MNIFNILFPSVCYACKMRLNSKIECLCSDCKTHLMRHKIRLFGEIDPQDKFFSTAVALFLYNYMTRQLLHSFKYRGLKQIGKYFGERAVEILPAEYPELLKVDATLGVPMLRAIERERGFNQATFLCNYISQRLNLLNLSDKIVKTVITSKQSLKSYNERIKDDYDIYKIKGENPFIGKTILIIDDIFTTGVTANILSRFLTQNGAKRVYVFVIAAGKSMKIRVKRKRAKLISEVF